jgi:hypothetical protein
MSVVFRESVWRELTDFMKSYPSIKRATNIVFWKSFSKWGMTKGWPGFLMHTVLVYTTQVTRELEKDQCCSTWPRIGFWMIRYVIFNMPKSENIKNAIRKGCRSELCCKGNILKNFWLLPSVYPFPYKIVLIVQSNTCWLIFVLFNTLVNAVSLT